MKTWPGSRWYRPVLCQSLSSFSMVRSSADGQQAVAYRHRITDLDIDAADGARLEGADLGFHLHRFEDDHQLALLHGLARLHQHLEDIAGQRSRLRLAPPRCDRGRGRGRSNVSRATDRLDAFDIATFVDLHDEGFAVDLDGVDLRLAGLAGRGLLAGRHPFERRRLAAG